MSVFQVCYDISSAKVRRRVIKELEGRGYRIQRSVFLLYGNRRDIEAIMERIRPLLEEQDSCIAVCVETNSPVIKVGTGEVCYEPESVVVI